jgi:hypothetical protein
LYKPEGSLEIIAQAPFFIPTPMHLLKGKKFREVKALTKLYYIAGFDPNIKEMVVKSVQQIGLQTLQITYYFAPPAVLKPMLENTTVESDKLNKLPVRKIAVQLDSSIIITVNAEPLIVSTTQEELEHFIANG